jgi:hypothetical protein
MIIEWCAQVTAEPDDSNITVLKRGRAHGDSGLMPVGGHMLPISILGANELWKNAQKNLKKKQISDRINKIIPVRSPDVVIEV